MARTYAAHPGGEWGSRTTAERVDPRGVCPQPVIHRDNVTGIDREVTLRVLTAALVLTLLFLASAFGDDTEQLTLRIGIAPDYPPFSHIDDEGQFNGFDVDIALALCARLEATCAFVRQDWEELIPGLRNGKFDAIVSSMSITEKRRQLVSFTDRYYSNVVRFVTRKDSGFDPEAPTGRTIGASRATVSSDWLEANLSGIADIRLFTDSGAPLQALVEGRVDAVLGDGLGFWDWLQSPQGAEFEFAGDGYRLDEGIGIAVRKDDDTLRLRLNQAIGEILADGTYQTINARYFPFSIY
ncbi:MAG: transporter substrate-binding domain-containing protein [bacterium]|nr:transporter substrate-binding domain-containing protein [bacterium]MDE0419164.1 transporter substrate-binding domain-containing protein [bacterium]